MNNQIQVVLKSSTTEMSLNDHDSGIYIVPELNGLTGLPDIRTTSGVNAGYDGGWTSAQNYDARSITLRGVIANEDKATVERMRKQLVSLLGQGKNEELTLDIVTEVGSAYEIQVRTIACEMAMQRVLTQQEFMIQLRADDPLIYDNTEAGEPAIVQVQKALGGFQIPFDIPLAIGGGEDASVIDNHGLEQVAPIVKMYGALHNPKIINQTTNQYMQIEADLGYAEGAYTDAETSDSGQAIEFNAPIAAPLADFSLKGDTVQDGTPTPDAPVAVQTVTGENVVKISDGQGNEQSYEVNLGKNLFDKDNYDSLNAYVSGSTITASANNVLVWIPCRPSTSYAITTASSNVSRSAYSAPSVPVAGGTANWLGSIAAGDTIGVFTTKSDAKYIVFRVWTNTATETLQEALDGLQIELGSQATSYAAYFEPIELCKISWGDYTAQDHIYENAGKWYIHKEIAKVTSNGDDGWSIVNSGAANYWYNWNNAAPGTYGNPDNARWLKSNYGIMAQVTSSDTNQGIFILRSGNVRIRYGSEMALADWKAKLAATSIAIYYAIATPTDTEITNTALIEQLDAILNSGRTYAGTNNITTVIAAGNSHGEVQVSYYTHQDPATRDEIVIDSRLRTITLNGLDIYDKKTEGSEFFMLAPGENKLMLQSDIDGDNGYAEVNYKQGYLSI